MRLNIENNYAFVKMVKLAILFAGIVKYCLQVALEGVETFAESIKVNKYISGKYWKIFCCIDYNVQFDEKSSVHSGQVRSNDGHNTLFFHR